MAEALRINFVGQALISHRFEPPDPAAWDSIRRWMAQGDVNFTNLEVSLWSKRAGGMMKSPEWTTSPSPDILDLLVDMGFNLMSLANNHSWDLGPAGVLDTIDEVAQRGFVHAGTGRDLEEAGRPAYIDTPNGRVALVAMASGNLPEQAFATSSTTLGPLARPGVNPLRVHELVEVTEEDFGAFARTLAALPGAQAPSGGELDFLGQRVVMGPGPGLRRVVDRDDEARNLASVAEAAEHADVVLVYFHQHHWEAEWQNVGDWMRQFARRCIDAGAHAFLGHGVPMLQPMEVYKGRWISYSLGNFVFHPTNGPTSWPDPRCWQSVVLQTEFEQGAWSRVRLRPITLAGDQALDHGDFDKVVRRQPLPASSTRARSILQNLASISAPFDTQFAVRQDDAELVLSSDAPSH